MIIGFKLLSHNVLRKKFNLNVGIVDSDYQNEIGIAVWNHGHESYTIQPGERICQMMFVPVLQPSLEIVEEFSDESARGLGGWGHSGKH